MLKKGVAPYSIPALWRMKKAAGSLANRAERAGLLVHDETVETGDAVAAPFPPGYGAVPPGGYKPQMVYTSGGASEKKRIRKLD